MEEIDLKELFDYFLKKIYVVILLVIISLSVGLIYTVYIKTPLYKSTTSIILASNENAATTTNTTITQADITINQNLVNTYTEIIKSKAVLERTISILGLDYNYSTLAKNISVTSVDNTEIINVSVLDKDPNKAKDIANEIADIFKVKVKDIYNMKNVSILDSAELSDRPDNINIVKEVILYIAIGLIIGLLYVFLRFYFDRNIKTISEVENKTELPIMGSVRDCSKINIDSKDKEKLLIDAMPKSNFAEDIKTIRTNLDFSGIDKKVKKVLITSSIPSEGKSFVSSNLAASFAQNNKKVLLIDCDLRKGLLHKRLNVKGKGLSTLIAKNDLANLDEYITKTAIEGLDVIVRGVIPPNPSELLSSKAFKELLRILEGQYDYIILDCPPVTNLPDSLIISNLVDKALIVSSIGYTPIDLLHNTIKSLQNVKAPIAGIIINKVPIKKGGYYYSSYKYE